MKILFVHQNIPGQYRNLCRLAAADPKNTVVFLTKRSEVEVPGVHKVEFTPPRDPSRTTHRYLIGVERAVIQGQETWRVCKKLRDEEGFTPDVIVGHPGWGDCLYLKDVWPNTPMLSYFEFYYHSDGYDVGFDPSDPASEDDKARVRTKNITNLLNLEAADWGISPTHWQKSVHPQEFQYKISVLHDGIDVNVAKPDPNAEITLPNGQKLKHGDEVVTYIARNMEPYRGFPTFMQAAEMIQKNRPNCHIIAIGADGVSYGRNLPKGETYYKQWKKKVKLDESRIHFVGMVPYETLIKILQVSAAHIYLTYPFVLSWSTLEALAAGCAIVGSATPPVEEVIEDGKTGLLVDFFSPEEVAKRVDEILDHKDRMADMRVAARKMVQDRFALEKLLPLHMELIKDVANGELSTTTSKKIDALYAA